MAIKNNSAEEFLTGIKEIEKTLIEQNFYLYSFEEKGYVHYIKYKKEDILLEFLFGPPEWHVEMIIFTSKGKFAFKDLLQIPAIVTWVNNNRFKQGTRVIEGEVLWFFELFKVALSVING